MKKQLALLCLMAAATLSASAQTYNIEPGHTYPSFEADHMGISIWRGKFNQTSGTVTLDRVAQTGTVEITIDAASIDFGHDKLNEHARGKDMFNVEQFPTVSYKGKLTGFRQDAPTEVDGELTLLGISRPVKLHIDKFKCIQHPMLKREVCGANATTSFKRTDFGMDYAISMGFSPEVKLAIQVEALKAD